MDCTLRYASRTWHWRADQPQSLSPTITPQSPQSPNAAQINAWGIPPAVAQPLEMGPWRASVADGASVNCPTLHLTPHGNGPHTEGVGHITREAEPVLPALHLSLHVALVLSVPLRKAADCPAESYAPNPAPDDDWLTAQALAEALAQLRVRQPHLPNDLPPALLLRTLPNPLTKATTQYADRAPYLSQTAMEWLAQSPVLHLGLDLPSVDRLLDEGRLTNHRLWWALPHPATRVLPQTRLDRTITEFLYLPEALPDGLYLASWELPPLALDAVPSRVRLYALCPDVARD